MSFNTVVKRSKICSGSLPICKESEMSAVSCLESETFFDLGRQSDRQTNDDLWLELSCAQHTNYWITIDVVVDLLFRSRTSMFCLDRRRDVFRMRNAIETACRFCCHSWLDLDPSYTEQITFKDRHAYRVGSFRVYAANETFLEFTWTHQQNQQMFAFEGEREQSWHTMIDAMNVLNRGY